MLTTKQKISAARWLQFAVMALRKLFRKGYVSEVKRNNIVWKLDLREGIDFAIWLMGYFEPTTVRAYKRIIRAGDAVLDIGANIGAHTLPMAQLVGDKGIVVAFEPTDYAFKKLRENCNLNPFLKDRIALNQVMLVSSHYADSVSSAPDIYSSWPLSDDSDLHELHRGRLMSTSGAKVTSLDNFLKDHPLGRIDCIKIDIDGYECEMFQGAKETLARYRPKLIMELAPHVLKEKGGSLEMLTSLLSALDYRFSTLSLKKQIPMDGREIEKMIPEGSGMNVVAISNHSSL